MKLSCKPRAERNSERGRNLCNRNVPIAVGALHPASRRPWAVRPIGVLTNNEAAFAIEMLQFSLARGTARTFAQSCCNRRWTRITKNTLLRSTRFNCGRYAQPGVQKNYAVSRAHSAIVKEDDTSALETFGAVGALHPCWKKVLKKGAAPRRPIILSRAMSVGSAGDWQQWRRQCEVTAVGFEPTPLRTGALSQRLRPLGQTVLACAPR